MLGISPLTSFILVLRVVSVAKLIILAFYLHFLILALYISFLTTSLSLLKPRGAGTNLSTSNLPTLLFKLFKLTGTFFN